MPYYLSLFVISLVGGYLVWKEMRFESIPSTDYAGVAKVYRSAGYIALTCALVSFGALVVSIVLRLDSYKFDFGWGSVALIQMLFWFFVYFAFTKPALHEYESLVEWKAR